MKSIFQHDEFYQSILRSFANDLPGMFATLKASYTNGQRIAARDASHKLAGTSATFGYPQLARDFQVLEMLLDQSESTSEEILDAMKQLEEMINSLSKEGL